MSLAYTNRRGKVYYIRAYRSKKGHDAWAMTAKPKECVLADAVPEGFEIYENPNGLVVLRKRLASEIRPGEVAAVGAVLVRQKHLKSVDTQLVLDKKTLTIHLLDREPDFLVEHGRREMGAFFGTDKYLARRGTYTAMMRLTLEDRDRRLFTIERFCFRGSVDRWIHLGSGEPLAVLAERFLPHLGKESFYNLMTGGDLVP